ncbi:MAG TPA: DUF3127 domain-containing protein [Flavobacteriaceae bacterium]|jgi:hypothetical protein
MSLRVEGKVKTLLPMQSGTSAAGKEWSKRDIVLTTEGQYPKDICITFFGQNASKLETYSTNDNVVADVEIESREWQGRYFSNINGRFIDFNLDIEKKPEAMSPNGTPMSTFEPTQGDDSDLPF